MGKNHHCAGIKPRMAATAIDFLLLAVYAGVLLSSDGS